MEKKSIVVIGAGGFAREVAWLIHDINRAHPTYDFRGYVVSDLARIGEHDSKDEIVGDIEWLAAHAAEVDAAAIGIGMPTARLKVAAEITAKCPRLEWPALVHPTVQFDRESCTLGRGVVLCAGTIATVNVVFEEFAKADRSCDIGHEARLGRGCALNPTVTISGGVVLEEGVLVGTGAQVLQYVRVGAHATVGAGAVVNKNVEPGQTVVGIPAKPLERKG